MNTKQIMEKLYIIKIGGNIIDNAHLLTKCLTAFSSIQGQAILVHGGGKLATELATTMGIEQTMVAGRRITDEATLKVVTMVYAGFINKNIVAQLQALGVNAMGLTGADGNLITAHKREVVNIDYGYVGDVDVVNYELINNLLSSAIKLVVAPITHDGKGQLLNTNADTIAQKMATGLTKHFEVHLVYGFEMEGVLTDLQDPTTLIGFMNKVQYENLKAQKIIFDGMIPKIDNAFLALEGGVRSVIIGKAEKLNQLINSTAGTTIKI